MTDSDRFRLLGTYPTPRVRLGMVVADEARGIMVVVVGMSDARTPWPIGKAEGGRARSLIVFAGLAEAVRRESNQAICHWWGVTPQTVSKWRKALGVDHTEGTSKLRSDYCFEEPFVEARKKAHAKAQDPERRAKIAAARKGKHRPWRVIKAVIKAHLGTKASEETRRKMSESHKARGTRPPKAGRPWTPEEDELLRTLSPFKAAVRCRRTLRAVYSRRHSLGIGR